MSERAPPPHGVDQPRPARLWLSAGDPAGIGPECIVQAWAAGDLDDAVVVGQASVLQRAATALRQAQPTLQRRLDALRLQPVDAHGRPPSGAPPEEPLAETGSGNAFPPLRVHEPPALDGPAGDGSGRSLREAVAAAPWGQVNAACGRASGVFIEAAVAAVRAGPAGHRALVTAPIHKEAFAAGGYADYPGHTELLQALATPAGDAPPPVRMMLSNPELAVVLVTIHQSLRSAIDAVTYEAVLQTLRIAAQAVPSRTVGQPTRIAVAGLNPHAGEGGRFGDEEVRVIAPAIAAARAEGIEASGPYPPDTVFMRARHSAEQPGAFDVVVAMTHDHGLIPVKYLGVAHGVNTTLGLPFVRTSPDHGTAFDIAGQGRADPASLRAALAEARRLLGAGRNGL